MRITLALSLAALLALLCWSNVLAEADAGGQGISSLAQTPISASLGDSVRSRRVGTLRKKVTVTVTVTKTIEPAASAHPGASDGAAEAEGEGEMPHGKVAGDEEELEDSWKMFFILIVLILCCIVVYMLIRAHFHHLPESFAVVFVGMMVGLATSITGDHWKDEESLAPTVFFLILLPPIIFDSGYSLHKANFFRNIGTILLFAVTGTLISSVVIGAGLYGLGVYGLSANLSLLHCLIFGSLISAVDPVATLAIFNALKVDAILHALVFGESVLNDAVSIVLCKTLLQIADNGSITMGMLVHALVNFLMMGFGSAFLGIVSGVASALLTKHVAFHTVPMLEYTLVCIFAYLPYVLAEALSLSGIMAILFCGITMAHYTHFNLSPVTQLTASNTFRMAAFVAETAVFAYLGLAVLSFSHLFDGGLVLWSIVLCLVARAGNIFPLARLANKYRRVKIPTKFQIIMWFSGLRGAIAFVLALDLPAVHFAEHYRVLVTTTLVIVLFTILFLGGATLPLLKMLRLHVSAADLDFNKTQAVGQGDAAEAYVMQQEDAHISLRDESVFYQWDVTYFTPWLRRKLTRSEIEAHEIEMQQRSSALYAQLDTPLTGHTSDQPPSLPTTPVPHRSPAQGNGRKKQ